MIRFGYIDFGSMERNAIYDLINDSQPQLSMGKNVYEFEKEFAEWLGSNYAVLVNSGTSALMTAIKAFKDENEPNSELITTTALTYCATWNAILNSGLGLLLKDVGKDFVMHYTFDNDIAGDTYDYIESGLSVHLLGKPCRIYTPIEDASEALGSSLKGRKLGTEGHYNCFSLYVAHQINTIEGGMITTDSKERYEALRELRDNGRICTCPICTLKVSGKCSKRANDTTDRRWATNAFGFNHKPTEFQGVLGLCKMKKIDANIKRRNEIFKWYADTFGTLTQEPDEFIVPIAYPIKVKDPQKAICKLEKEGIETRGMFPAYSKQYVTAYELSRTHILIPAHQGLSDKDVQYIIEKVKCLE